MQLTLVCSSAPHLVPWAPLQGVMSTELGVSLVWPPKPLIIKTEVPKFSPKFIVFTDETLALSPEGPPHQDFLHCLCMTSNTLDSVGLILFQWLGLKITPIFIMIPLCFYIALPCPAPFATCPCAVSDLCHPQGLPHQFPLPPHTHTAVHWNWRKPWLHFSNYPWQNGTHSFLSFKSILRTLASHKEVLHVRILPASRSVKTALVFSHV